MRPTASPIAFRGACLRPHAHRWVGVGWREGCGEVKRQSKSPKRATAYRMFTATPRHGPPARARTLGGEQGSRPSGHASPSACAQTSGEAGNTPLVSPGARDRPAAPEAKTQQHEKNERITQTARRATIEQIKRKAKRHHKHKMRLAAQGGRSPGNAAPKQTP